MNYHGLKPDGFNFTIQVGLVRRHTDERIPFIHGLKPDGFAAVNKTTLWFSSNFVIIYVTRYWEVSMSKKKKRPKQKRHSDPAPPPSVVPPPPSPVLFRPRSRPPQSEAPRSGYRSRACGLVQAHQRLLSHARATRRGLFFNATSR